MRDNARRRGRAAALALAISFSSALPLWAARCRYVYHGFRIWNVCSDGRAEPLETEFLGGDAIEHLGTTSPVPSPDGRRIAYTRDNDLWIFEPATNLTTRVTRVGRPSDEEYASVYVLITSWSPDGTRILYNVAHSDPEDPEGYEPTREVPPASYGFRVYDLSRHSAQGLRLPGEFEAWLSDGDFLLTSAEPELLYQTLLRYRAGVEVPKRLSPLRGSWGQINIAGDGSKALVALSYATPLPSGSGADESRLLSQIFQLDLKTESLTPVSPVGSWSEFQTPTFSPSGTRVAYVRQTEQDASGFAKGTLIVDGRSLVPFEGLPFEYAWIDDDSLVLIHDAGLVVVSADSGHELGRKRFSVAQIGSAPTGE